MSHTVWVLRTEHGCSQPSEPPLPPLKLYTRKKTEMVYLTSILCTWGIRLRSLAIPYLPLSSSLNGELWDEDSKKSAQECSPEVLCSVSSPEWLTTNRQVIPVTITSYFQGERKNTGWVHMVHRQRGPEKVACQQTHQTQALAFLQ